MDRQRKEGRIRKTLRSRISAGSGAFCFKDAPKLYGLDEKPAIPESVVFWHNVLKPLAYIGFGGAVAASLLHYVAFGPKKDEEVKRDE